MCVLKFVGFQNLFVGNTVANTVDVINRSLDLFAEAFILKMLRIK